MNCNRFDVDVTEVNEVNEIKLKKEKYPKKKKKFAYGEIRERGDSARW